MAAVGQSSGEVPYTVYCARKSFISQNPNTIKAFSAAIQKGLDFVNNSTSEEIAKSIKFILDNPQKGIEFAEHAKKHVEDCFLNKTILPQYATVIVDNWEIK